MRALIPAVVLVALLVAALILLVHGPSQASAAQTAPSVSRSSPDVVLLRCKTGPTEDSVVAFQRSSGAPAKRSNNCAQALSDVLGDRFEMRDSGLSQNGEFVTYTLVR